MSMKEIKFSNNLRMLRKSKNMSQEDLAKLLKVDRRTISVWERGVCEPSFVILAKLCEIFDETFDDILT